MKINRNEKLYYGILGEMVLGADSTSDLESCKNDVNEKTLPLKDETEVKIHHNERNIKNE